MKEQSINIFWFRRDLRLSDNHGLYQALAAGSKVLALFIFDRDILDDLEVDDRRVEFIHQEISRLKSELNELGSDLLVRYGKTQEIFTQLSQDLSLKGVFSNRDYEPYATQRDQAIEELLAEKGIAFQQYKDQCIFEKKEILTKQGGVYGVFTPYSRTWKAALKEKGLSHYPSEDLGENYLSKGHSFWEKDTHQKLISLSEMGFEAQGKDFPDREVPEKIIKVYDEKRNFPAQRGTTRLSIHLRFGTLSIRHLVKKAQELNQTWLNELIWRDFYMMILANYPRVEKESYRKEYDQIQWRNNEEEFAQWCAGKTGYPMVDAGMREMNETGFMHNRVRMVTASFLSKHLLIDWRWGERYFAKKLLDYELSSNNGGWQWASGSGNDAAPYFRIFNPESQLKKFDPDLKYIRKWVPEFQEMNYRPIVDHKFARERCLETYKEALKKED